MAQLTKTYLTTEELAERFRTSAGTVRYWRHVRKGPPSFRLGSRVLYDLDLIEAWEQGQAEAQYAVQARGDEA